MQDRYRLPRSVIPSRYDLTIEPDLEAATFSGTEAVTVEVARAHRRDRHQRPGPRDRQRVALQRRRNPDRGERHRLRRGAAARHARPCRSRRSWLLDAAPGVPRRAERPAPRLLPFHLRRRRRRHPHDRHHAVRGGRRPARLPVLGRTRPQGRVRHHPDRPRRARRHLQRPRGGARGPGRRPDPRPIRRHDEHVHLPGGVRGGPARVSAIPSTPTACRSGSSTFRARAI